MHFLLTPRSMYNICVALLLQRAALEERTIFLLHQLAHRTLQAASLGRLLDQFAFTLESLADGADEGEEALFDINSRLCARFKERAVEALGQIGTLSCSDDSLCCQIALVADENAGNVVILLDAENLRAEGRDFVEGSSGSNIVHHQEALTSTHVLITHSGKLLLSGCVENVQKTSLRINLNLLAVRILNCWIIFIHEVVVDQLNGQCGLANTATSNYDELVFGHVFCLVCFVLC